MKAYNLSSAEEVMKNSETAYFLTSGTSMMPLIRTHKDIVVISRICENVAVGDVVLYKKQGENKLVLHRIIKLKKGGSYIIRGDNTYKNELVSSDNILGVMTAIYRSGRYIDCKKSLLYKLYVRLNMLFFPFRFVFKNKLCNFLVKIKRKILS